jgi:hypothetical protein
MKKLRLSWKKVRRKLHDRAASTNLKLDIARSLSVHALWLRITRSWLRFAMDVIAGVRALREGGSRGSHQMGGSKLEIPFGIL